MWYFHLFCWMMVQTAVKVIHEAIESDEKTSEDEEESLEDEYDEEEPNNEELKDVELSYQIRQFSFEVILKKKFLKNT